METNEVIFGSIIFIGIVFYLSFISYLNYKENSKKKK